MINSPIGYYQVNNETYLQKVEAVYRASETRSELEWFFHDDVFNSHNWTVEPTESLDELYRQRAQQIRDQYDYVLIFASGGADSTNIINSFYKNNIHIDEIVAGAPVSGLKNWEDSSDKRAWNTITETTRAQIPLMQLIAKNHPETRVTLHDYFVDMLEYDTDEWLWKSSDYLHPTFAARYQLRRYKHINDLCEQGKSIALVYGIDKPQIAEMNGEFYAMFRDVNVCNGFQSIDSPTATVELFYWTPDFVKLPIKQAHVAVDYMLKDPRIYNNIMYTDRHLSVGDDRNLGWLARRSGVDAPGYFERAIVPAIYPTADKDLFQCEKPVGAFIGQHDDWFRILHKDSKAHQMMKSDYKHFINSNIDQKYFVKTNDQVLGFKNFRKFFKLGLQSNPPRIF